MGNNSCLTTVKSKSSKWRNGDQIPEGLEYKSDEKQLDFELSVTNIDLRNPPSGSISLSVQIDRILKWKYEKIKGIDVLSWRQENRISIRATEYQLKNMFMNFRFFDSQGIQIGVLPLNMFLIVTGPWRNDFLIRFNGGQTGRLSAHIKCTQIIMIEMKTTKAQLNFIDQHPGEMFHFSLKTQDLVGNSQYTQESYDVETFLYNKKRSYEMDSEGESATYNKRKTMILQNHKGLQWSDSISQKGYKKQLPWFKIPVKVDSISNYSFHFILWKKSQDCDDTFESYGEANIPLAKLFWTDIKGGNLNPQVGATRNIQIQQPIEYLGKKCGNMNFCCKVTTPKLFQQVLIFTRTQLGLTLAKRQLYVENQNQCDDLKKMQKIKQTMIDQILQSGIVKNQLTQKGMKLFREHRHHAYQDILKLQNFFLQGHGSSPLFDYATSQILIKAQIQIMDVIEKTLSLTDLRETDFSQTAWRTLKVIVFRGQFLLSKIGFRQEQIELINNNSRQSLPKLLQQKINVCESYQALILRLLILCLSKFGKKLMEEQLHFISAVCTIAYYKIPQFRQQLLKQIVNPKDKSRIYCYEKSHNKSNFEKLVDWSRLFSQPLSVYGTNSGLLLELSKLTRWKQILKKRGFYYFTLIQNWASNTGKVLGFPDSIRYWNVIPGYDTVIGSFLFQMETKSINQYTDVMKDANMALLSNECLFPIFLKLLLERTNICNINQTLKSLQLIGAYFAYFSYNNQVLPSCFDTKLLYLAIKGIITSQNCFAISKILQLIYLYFNVFSNHFKKQLTMLLFGRYFFCIMLNWSRVVRQIFRYLIIYRIIIWAKDKQIIDVTTRWKLLQQILQKQQYNANSLKKQTISLHYQNNFFQKMKSKLHSRRRKQSCSLESISLTKYSKSQPFSFQTDYSLEPYSAMSQSCLSLEKKNSLNDIKTIQQNNGVRRSSDPGNMKTTKQRRVSFFNDLSINQQELAYLEYYKKQMNKIEELFKIWSKNTVNKEDIPRVEIKVPIDEGDMRPET